MPRSNTPRNRILAALPKEEFQRISADLEEFELIFADHIYETDEKIEQIYFPESGIISLLSSVEDQATLEVGIVGSEGIVGLPVFLGVEKSNNRAIVQGKGVALKISAANFLKQCERGEELSRLLRRYTLSLLTQISQSSVCNRYHQIETRLARWLLMSSDRMGKNEFLITQEFLSNMLGVRREAVNKAALNLQKQNLIEYSRGTINILNRKELEKSACKCYQIIKQESE